MIRQCVRPLRCFTTLAEARAVAASLPLPDHLPLLSSIPEGVLEGVPPDKHSSALQILSMQRPDAWKQLKGLFSEQLVADPTNSSLYLTAVVSKLRTKGATFKKKPRNTQKQASYLDGKEKMLSELPVSSTLDRITTALYWLDQGHTDYLARCLSGVQLKEVLDCFQLIRPILVDPSAPIGVVELVIRHVMTCGDLAKLAALCTIYPGASLAGTLNYCLLALSWDVNECHTFPALASAKVAIPPHHPLISVVGKLLQDSDPGSRLEIFTKYLVHLSNQRDSVPIYNILIELKMPEDVLRQTCLEFLHNDQDDLLLTTLLACQGSFLDVAGILTPPNLSTPQEHVLELATRYLTSPLLPYFMHKYPVRGSYPITLI
eukprot:sb/3465750/